MSSRKRKKRSQEDDIVDVLMNTPSVVAQSSTIQAIFEERTFRDLFGVRLSAKKTKLSNKSRGKKSFGSSADERSLVNTKDFSPVAEQIINELSEDIKLEVESMVTGLNLIIFNINELFVKFQQALEQCNNKTLTQRMSMWWTEGSQWRKEFANEAADLQRTFRDAANAIQNSIVPNDSSQRVPYFRSLLENYTHLSDIHTKIKRLIKRVETACPPEEEVKKRDPWFTLSPYVQFEFKREGIPEDLQQWIVRPLEKKQNPKAIVEVIMANKECPEFKINDPVGNNGWVVKMIRSSSLTTNPYWQSGEVFVKRFDEFVNLYQNFSSLTTTQSLEEMQRLWTTTKEILEPLVAYHMQNVKKCRLFMGIQKPSDDDEQLLNPDDRSTGMAVAATITQELQQSWQRFKLGVSQIIGENTSIMAGMLNIASSSLSMIYIVLVKSVFTCGIPSLIQKVFSLNPLITGTLVVSAILVGPALISSLVTFETLQTIPTEASSVWNVLRGVTSWIVNDLGVSPTVISCYYKSWSNFAQFIHQLVCNRGIIVRFCIEYFVIKEIILKWSLKTPRLTWLLNAFFSGMFRLMVNAVCDEWGSNLLQWAWSSTAGFGPKPSAAAIPSSLITSSSLQDSSRAPSSRAAPPMTQKDTITDFYVVKSDELQSVIATKDGALYSCNTTQLDSVSFYTTSREGQQEDIESSVSESLVKSGLPEIYSRPPVQGFLYDSRVEITRNTTINQQQLPLAFMRGVNIRPNQLPTAGNNPPPYFDRRPPPPGPPPSFVTLNLPRENIVAADHPVLNIAQNTYTAPDQPPPYGVPSALWEVPGTHKTVTLRELEPDEIMDINNNNNVPVTNMLAYDQVSRNAQQPIPGLTTAEADRAFREAFENLRENKAYEDPQTFVDQFEARMRLENPRILKRIQQVLKDFLGIPGLMHTLIQNTVPMTATLLALVQAQKNLFKN